MTDSPALSADALKVDGLTIADELVVLHTYPRAKRDYSLGWVGYTAAAGVLADLVLAGRVALREIDRNELSWWRRRFGEKKGMHSVGVVLEDATLFGDELLDSVLQRIPSMQGRGLPWCLEKMKKTWEQINHRLYDSGLKIRGDKHGKGGGVDPQLEERMARRLRPALLGPGVPDDHTAAVVLLAHAAELFKPGSGEHELVGPIDDAAVGKQVTKLAASPSLTRFQDLARASAQARRERGQRTERQADATVWHS